MHFKDSVALELPGHPTRAGLTSIPAYAESVRDQIGHHEWSDVILVGHSMGGAVAIELALTNQVPRGLVLVGTGARLKVHPELLAELRENYENAAKHIASWSVSPSADPIIIDRFTDSLLQLNPQVTLVDYLACDKFDRMDDLEKVTCPTLVVCGEDDKMTPPKYSTYLHEKIRGSKLVVIPGAGHSVMLEKHREFNRAIERFVVSLSASAQV